MKKIKTVYLNYCKHFIVVITFITSVNIVVAQGTLNLKEKYYQITVKQPPIDIPQEVTINGIVKDEVGNPLVNAAIKADYGRELITDNKGLFSFTLQKEQVTAQSIFVSYDGLVTAIRSYHPWMINTTYDITLYKPVVCCKKKKCEGIEFKSFSVYFKNNTSNLTEDTKKQLDEITVSLKDCPTSNVTLTVHSGSRKSLQGFGEDQLKAVKKYLIEHNSITIERIKTNEVTDKGVNNRVDVIQE